MTFPMKSLIRISVALATSALLTACAPKVGSEAWCTDIKEKPPGELTLNETAQFAKYCVLRLKPEEE